MSLITNVFRPVVADDRGFRRYVASVVTLSMLVAVATEIVHQLLTFSSRLDCAVSLGITAFTVVVIAVPIARTMGRAHLELHHAKNEAVRLSRTDPLTGLANRRAFYEAAAALDDAALALVIADIDRFKRINDSFGHAAGDEVIKAVARLMQQELGDIGTVARVGGEEFAFVAAHVQAGALRERIARFRMRVAGEAVEVGGKRVFVTVSAGVAARQGVEFDALYAAADKALYVAKSAGRDRIVDADEIADVAPAAFAKAG